LQSVAASADSQSAEALQEQLEGVHDQLRLAAESLGPEAAQAAQEIGDKLGGLIAQVESLSPSDLQALLGQIAGAAQSFVESAAS
jgi:hypothetical protein